MTTGAELAVVLAELADPAPVVPAPDWSKALCPQTDPEAFFPEKGGTTRPAKTVCRRCEIRPECLAWAVATGQPHGVWGGMGERERRRLRRQVAREVGW